MCSVQSIIIIVIREVRRFPVRICGMAHRTVCRESEDFVIRITCSFVITEVTCRAICGGASVSGTVAADTIHNEVSPRKWEVCHAMIEGCRYPCGLIMTNCAIRWIPFCLVVRVSRAVIVIEVTTDAGVRGIIIITVVADNAIICD